MITNTHVSHAYKLSDRFSLDNFESFRHTDKNSHVCYYYVFTITFSFSHMLHGIVTTRCYFFPVLQNGQRDHGEPNAQEDD